MTAHQANLAEIVGGRLAEEKGTSRVVRSLGARFVADHTRLDAALTRTADALGVTLPNIADAEQQALAADYRAASGAVFDRLYLTTQLVAHAKAMAAVQSELATGSDPAAEALAAAASPVVMAHHTSLQVALGYESDAGRR